MHWDWFTIIDENPQLDYRYTNVIKLNYMQLLRFVIKQFNGNRKKTSTESFRQFQLTTG
jgi:hypothetical protein